MPLTTSTRSRAGLLLLTLPLLPALVQVLPLVPQGQLNYTSPSSTVISCARTPEAILDSPNRTIHLVTDLKIDDSHIESCYLFPSSILHSPETTHHPCTASVAPWRGSHSRPAALPRCRFRRPERTCPSFPWHPGRRRRRGDHLGAMDSNPWGSCVFLEGVGNVRLFFVWEIQVYREIINYHLLILNYHPLYCS